jgi:hypothetical protein
MLKKSLIFGSVALFIAAFITLTGCPTSVDDDDSSGTVFTHRIYGENVNPYQAQEAIENALKAGEAIVLEHNLSIQRGELNFKNVQVRVNGKVMFRGGVMNVADASVSWAPGAEIDITGGAYILREGQKPEATNKVPDGAMVEFKERVEDIMSTSRAAAVRNFKLGLIQNYDYSRDSNGVDAKITNPSLEVLFVVGTLSIPSEATELDNLALVSLGTADATGTIPVGVLNSGIGLGTCSTLTSSRGVTLTLPDGEMVIPNVRIEAENDITLKQVIPGPLNIPGKLTGPGILTVAATDITINGGDGNFIAAGAVPRTLSIYSTGKAVFANTVTIPVGGSSVVYSDVVFKDDVTTYDTLGLYGDVTLGHGPLAGTTPGIQRITINSGKQLILGAGKTITLQIEPNKSTQTIQAPLLTAVGGNVVLTADGGAVWLDTPARPKDDQPGTIAIAKLINLTGTGSIGTLEITNGTLQVLPEATIVIDQPLSTKVDGAAGQFGYLAVAEGGTLSLKAGDTLTIGEPQIGGGAFIFTASGGTIKLGNHRITGSAPGTKLVPAKGTSGTSAIDVGGNETLTLEEVELDLAALSKITIANTGKVTLDKGAKITLVAGENGLPTEWSNIKAGSTAQVTGAFVGLTPDPTAATKQYVWSVAHKGGELAAVNIIAGGAVTLGKTPKAEFTR